MKKLLTTFFLFVILMTAFSFFSNLSELYGQSKEITFTEVWALYGDTAPDWFTDGTEADAGSPAYAGVERGIVYNALYNHVYVSSRYAEDTDGDDVIDTPEPHVFVLDANTGTSPVVGVDRLITSGIESYDENYGGGYCLNNVTMSEDGSIFACNMTLASGPDLVVGDATYIKAFRVYRWSWEQDLPQMIINYTEGGYRLGDKFSVIGDWDEQAYIYAVPGENTKMLRWAVTSGVVNETPETITLQDISTVGTSGTVAPVPGHDDWVYVSGKGFMPTLFSTTGTNLSQVDISTADAPSRIAGRTIEFNNKIYMAMFSGDQSAFVFDVSKHGENVTDADVIGYTPTFGVAYSNAWGEGAVEFGVIDSILNVFVCGPSNGIARYRIDGLVNSFEPEFTKEFKLSSYPNPANNYTNIHFTLPANAQGAVAVKIYDISGKFVSITADKAIGGAQEISINTSKLSKGLYIYKVVFNNKVASGKLSVN